MDAIIQPGAAVTGTLSVPADKAVCHRAVLAAAIAQGETTLTPWPSADDCQRTLDVIRALGVRIQRSGETVRIVGRAGAALEAPQADLWCGESGTTFRLVAGLLAGQPITARLCAGPSLSARPMRRIMEPLSAMGATLEGTARNPRSAERYPPVTMTGRRPLQPIRYEMPIASAQVKSAILFAALFAHGRTTVVEPHPTRDHTERMLRAFGATVRRDGAAIVLDPAPLVSPGMLALPGDFSSAAFLLVAAACVPGSRVTVTELSLNPTRTALLKVLSRMGAVVHQEERHHAWEPRGAITIEAGGLRGISVEPNEVPAMIDELPILMVAAACASGRTSLRGLGELRVKETDRIQSMVTGLSRLGTRVRLVPPDALEIDGGPLTGAAVDSAGDHRTAMSLAVAALVARGATTIRGIECVAKSFPEFFDCLRRLAGSSTVKTVDKP